MSRGYKLLRKELYFIKSDTKVAVKHIEELNLKKGNILSVNM